MRGHWFLTQHKPRSPYGTAGFHVAEPHLAAPCNISWEGPIAGARPDRNFFEMNPQLAQSVVLVLLLMLENSPQFMELSHAPHSDRFGIGIKPHGLFIT